MSSELSVVVVMISAHGGLLDSAIHAFDLAVGPRMIGFGEAVFDAVAAASPVEGMPAQQSGDALPVPGQIGELDAVVGEHGMDVVRDRLDQSVEKVRGGLGVGSLDEPGDGELGSAIYGDEEVELSFGGGDFGDVDMKVANGIGFELFLFTGCGVAFHLRQPIDPVTLKAAMKGGSRQLRDRRLERIETVVQGQEGVFAKSHRDGLLFKRKDRGARRRPHRCILDILAATPLGHRLGIDVVARGQRSQALLTMLDRPTHCRRRPGAPV